MVDLTISNFFSKRIFPSFGISILTVLIASFQIHAQGTNSIVIGTIESSIERKQVPIDLGKTSRSFASKVGRAISLHGGLRLADTKSSLFSANFTQEGQSGVKLELLKGQPKVPFADFSLDAGSVD